MHPKSIFQNNTMRTPVRILYIFILSTLSFIASGEKPHIHIIATGGTIAGTSLSGSDTRYSAGQLTIEALLSAVPQIGEIAQITAEQLVNIGSQDIDEEIWIKLSCRVNELLNCDDIDGIVITHGTDTMEESAFFLQLTTNSTKAVVLTGAMRPSTSLSADGPLNLYNAVAVAACADASDRGVMVTMNNSIFSATDVTKMHTTDIDAFQAPENGKIGSITGSKVTFNTPPYHHTLTFPIKDGITLPKVGIVYSYGGIDPDMVTFMIENKYRGIVHAGVGNGNIHKNIFPILEEGAKEGILIVRSSRVAAGPVTLENEVDDNKYHFVASQGLNPQKSRILLMLSLTKTHNWEEVQRYFNMFVL